MYEGVPYFSVAEPVRESKSPGKDFPKLHKYTKNRVSNMRRDIDTFQLNKTLDDIKADNDLSLRAFSENKAKSSQQHWFRLRSTQTYNDHEKLRPTSVQFSKLQENNMKLNTECTTQKEHMNNLRRILQAKKREGLLLRNRIQTHRFVDENSYAIQSNAVKQSDQNFSCRRQAESIDKQLKQEKQKELLLQTEVDELRQAVDLESQKVQRLDNDNATMYKRILEKSKQKKDMEETLKKQEATLKHLESAIEHLMLTEQGCLRIIENSVTYRQGSQVPSKGLETSLIYKQGFTT